MTLSAVVARFEEQAPLTVMARLTIQRALDPAWLDALFESERQRQYKRELLFSAVVDVMARTGRANAFRGQASAMRPDARCGEST